VSFGKGKELNIPKVWAELKQRAPATFSNNIYEPKYEEEDFKRVAALLKIEEADLRKLVETPSVVQHDNQAAHS